MSGSPWKSSIYRWLEGMEIGERRYVESTLDEYAKKQRHFASARSRRPEFLKDYEFSTQLFTAVSAKTAGDIRFLVCVERMK